ncbi:MAG: glycosyltransferase [Actinobacteria bacterium]|nr:glycosyltransferase [Actinomycetota bacterium]
MNRNRERRGRESNETDCIEPENSMTLPPGWTALFLANAFTSVPEASGGTKHFVEVAGHWRDSGTLVLVMTPEVGRQNCEMEGFGGPYLILPPSRATNLGIASMFLVRGLTAPFFIPWRSSRILFYSASDFLPDVLPASIGRILKGKNSFWAQRVYHLIPPPSQRPGSPVSNTVSYLSQRVILLMIRKLADLVIVGNPILKKQLVGKGFRENKVFITRMGTDIPGPLPDVPKRFDACYLGRLHPSKGVLDLPDIWNALLKIRPGSKLAIIGTGQRNVEEQLEKKLRRMKLENSVKLMGYLSREDVDLVLSSSRIFVTASREEGFGIGLLEAMSRGLVPVAYKLPHYHKIFGNHVMTVRPGDIETFAKVVADLLNDEQSLESKSEECRRFARKFSWSEVSALEAGAIAEAIDRKCGKGSST